MKAGQKINKSPYNPPPVKLRAQIIQDKIIKKKQQTPPSSESESEQSSYDSEVEDFANQFYDQQVEKADKSLLQKKDNQMSSPPLNDQKSSKEQKKIKKIQTQYDKISQRLKQLKSNYDDLDMDAILFKKKDEKKLKQIAQFLSKKHKEKRDFKKKLKKIKNSQRQRKKIEEQMRLKQQKQQNLTKIKQIRKKSSLIKDKTDKNRQQDEQKLQKVEQFYEQFYKKYKNRKLYQLMQMNQKKKRNKQIQKQRQYLKQRKHALSQIISPQQLQQFKKRQDQVLRDLQKVKYEQKNQKNQQIAQKNKQFRDKIYISNQYMQIQQQEMKRQKLKQMPKLKLNKIKKYDSYVRENFIPVNQKLEGGQEHQKQQEEEEQTFVQINGKQYRRVKQTRYLKGQIIGEIIRNVPIAKTQQQIKMTGDSYLEALKLLPKRRHSTSLDLSRLSDLKPKSTTPRIQIPKIPKKMGRISLPKDANRYEVENLIKILKSKDELITRKQHILKVASKNSSGFNPQNQELDDNLLDNIEKKINLLGRL